MGHKSEQNEKEKKESSYEWVPLAWDSIDFACFDKIVKSVNCSSPLTNLTPVERVSCSPWPHVLPLSFSLPFSKSTGKPVSGVESTFCPFHHAKKRFISNKNASRGEEQWRARRNESRTDGFEELGVGGWEGWFWVAPWKCTTFN